MAKPGLGRSGSRELGGGAEGAAQSPSAGSALLDAHLLDAEVVPHRTVQSAMEGQTRHGHRGSIDSKPDIQPGS